MWLLRCSSTALPAGSGVDAAFDATAQVRKALIERREIALLDVTSADRVMGVRASLFAPELAATTGAGVPVVTGGDVAWTSTGSALRSGERLTMSPIDVSKRPDEGTDNDAQAMQAYLDWEYGLVRPARAGWYSWIPCHLRRTALRLAP